MTKLILLTLLLINSVFADSLYVRTNDIFKYKKNDGISISLLASSSGSLSTNTAKQRNDYAYLIVYMARLNYPLYKNFGIGIKTDYYSQKSNIRDEYKYLDYGVLISYILRPANKKKAFYFPRTEIMIANNILISLEYHTSKAFYEIDSLKLTNKHQYNYISLVIGFNYNLSEKLFIQIRAFKTIYAIPKVLSKNSFSIAFWFRIQF